MKKEIGISVLLFVLCAVTSVMNPKFLSPVNLVNTANLIGLYGVFSLGLGLVIITGGIDLSVGSMCALTGIILTMGVTQWHWSWQVTVLVVLGVSGLLGLAHGLLITRGRLQPFIVTLCGLLLYRGIARYIAHDSTQGFSGAEGIDHLRHFTSGKLFGLPAPFIILVVLAVVMWFVLHRSIYGRYLLAVGRNEQAARFSGINTRLVITSAYVIAAFLTGVSGILIAFYTNSVGPSNHGNFYELYGIAAAVLGGCSLRGGEGSVVGIVFGTALLLVLQNLVNLLGIDSSLNFAVMGAVVLLGVLADQLFKNRSAKKIARA
ncbi:MAG TPA: ABC transporter permease [Verrucomicrobiae bacterium]|nr:ABC transporter permease [Verrucomicrobiae bacterium]